MTTARIMITSAKLSFSTTASTPLISAAASRMMIMGSAICSKKRRIRDLPGASASRFLPFASRRRAASSALRPSAVVDSWFNVVSVSSQ